MTGGTIAMLIFILLIFAFTFYLVSKTLKHEN